MSNYFSPIFKISIPLLKVNIEENLKIEVWTKIKEKLYDLSTDNEEKTLPDMDLTLQLLLYLNAHDNIIENFENKKLMNYLINDFFFSAAKYLIYMK